MSISEISAAMQVHLGSVSDRLAVKSSFVRRASKLGGSVFVRTLVFGWLSKPDASLQDLTQTAAALGVRVTPQGLDERFGPAAATFLRSVLAEVVCQAVCAEEVVQEVLNRFSGVYVLDSTIIPLPTSLGEMWPGCGGTNGNTAALKLHVCLDLSTGALQGPFLAPGREHDRRSPVQREALPKGALRIADLGFFDLKNLASLDAQGVYFLTRVLNNTLVYDDNGLSRELTEILSTCASDELVLEARIGATVRLPVRIVARRVPKDVVAERVRRLKDKARKKCQPLTTRSLDMAGWSVYATNVPADRLSSGEGHALMRLRWQIELLFKLWKDEGHLDQSRSHKPWRILCEIYAKLIGLIIQHWILLVCCWRTADRSLTKAGRTLRTYANTLASCFDNPREFTAILAKLARILSDGCRLSRRTQPNSYQLLLPGALA